MSNNTPNISKETVKKSGLKTFLPKAEQWIEKLAESKTLSFTLIFFCLIWLVVGPILLTQVKSVFDFTNTGQIGDTFGGIVTPILTFVAAVLSYFVFIQQIKNNKIQRDALDEQRTSNQVQQNAEMMGNLLLEIKEEFNGLIFEEREFDADGNIISVINVSRGAKALGSYQEKLESPIDIEEFNWRVDEIEDEFESLLDRVSHFVGFLSKAKLTDDMRVYYWHRFKSFYDSKMEGALEILLLSYETAQHAERCKVLQTKLKKVTDSVNELNLNNQS